MIIPEIIWQHVEDAGFLWALRGNAVQSPHYSLEDLASLDDRIEAHVDGLRIAGDEAWPLFGDGLPEAPAGKIFAAAALAFDGGNETRIAAVLALAIGSPTLCRAISSTFGWMSWDRAAGFLAKLADADSVAARTIGLLGAVLHRRDPGLALHRALHDADAHLKARALRAVGELGRNDLISEARQVLHSDDEDVRFWAAWALAIVSPDASGIKVLQAFSESCGRNCKTALDLILRVMDLGTAKAWQRKLSMNPRHIKESICSAGIIGDPEYLPWLVEKMKRPVFARGAAEAFTAITGADVGNEKLDAKAPEGFLTGPNDNPTDENVAIDQDENLPWPDPALIQEWLHKNRPRFQNGTRYLLGKPMTIDWLKTVLRDGRQRQRAAAALELSIRQPGTPLFNVKAPGFRQIELLGKPGEPIR